MSSCVPASKGEGEDSPRGILAAFQKEQISHVFQLVCEHTCLLALALHGLGCTVKEVIKLVAAIPYGFCSTCVSPSLQVRRGEGVAVHPLEP
jgi:Zn finger protein HypA/HybF involved in hydrogenase expression